MYSEEFSQSSKSDQDFMDHTKITDTYYRLKNLRIQLLFELD